MHLPEFIGVIIDADKVECAAKRLRLGETVVERSADQELFEDTTRRFLESQSPVTKLRDLAGTKAGFEPDYWHQGAELGWTSLVVPEEAGGGSVSGSGVIDLALLAYQFGLHAAPGPLGPTRRPSR